ncbi:menaquinone biosynthesis protein [Leptospira bouyouniensis]|uniref:Chorismate dehydratase n=1 Tax=Leptospira bouyouniensis TaxID=2484911 RepID=A0A7I0HQ32_9LEPT|nr:MqnA/MqnD/SBP family protein [Leptospira bouyouniensis]TGK48338.1 menaquinone biosynthesis protein [Leptospira bouyouniensis]TGL04309.1 menaquinone biosynthesis protein [Leptospira bouyouniensis]
MKIGIVKHLNARPLTLYFERSPDFTPVYDNPSVLIELLKKGELDCALVSSIECERNKDKFDYTKIVGVCARDVVRSVLFFKNENDPGIPGSIFTDKGSRSSVCLLQCLFHLEYGKKLEVIPTDAKEISEMMQKGIGSHLLFGDHALLQTPIPGYQVIDLAEWWNRLTGLYFCFAFWAYPKGKQWDNQIFLTALEYGLKELSSIISEEKRLPIAITDRYLKQELHFIPEQKNLDGFALFIKTAKELDLL